jgi:hypothetical protein
LQKKPFLLQALALFIQTLLWITETFEYDREAAIFISAHTAILSGAAIQYEA